jgi:tol-pal system protein YbgF
MRKTEEAAAAFSSFMKDHDGSELAGDARYWFGEHCLSMRRYDKAKTYFDQIITGFPASDLAKEAMMRIALILLEEGKDDEAVSKLEELIGRYDGSDAARAAHKEIAKIKRRNKEFDQAIGHLEKVITGNGDEADAQIRYEIAESYEDKGDLAKAVEEYHKVFGLYSSVTFWPVRAQLKCAQDLEKLDRPNDAMRLYEKLADMGIEESDFARRRLDALR